MKSPPEELLYVTALYVGTTGSEGDVIVRDNSGREVIHANGSNAALYVGTKWYRAFASARKKKGDGCGGDCGCSPE